MNNKTSLPARAFIETEADAARFWQIGILWRLMASGIKTANTLSFLDEVVGGEPGRPGRQPLPRHRPRRIGQPHLISPGSWLARPGAWPRPCGHGERPPLRASWPA